jgi:hypothetical protein
MATKRLNQLTEATTTDDGDIYHLENVAGFDRFITKQNFLSSTDAKILAAKGGSPNNQVGTSYTLQLSDAEATEIWMNNGSANTVVLPIHAATPMPEQNYTVVREGTGVTAIAAPAGVLLNGVDGGNVTITSQYKSATLTKRADNTWVVRGDII